MLLLTIAAAADLPTWKWTAGPVKYHLETEIYTPTGYRIYARENLDARVRMTRLVLDTDCTAEPVGKNVEVTCGFAYASVSGEAYVDAESGKLREILAEWSDDLGRVTVVMFLGADGKLKEFDVKRAEVGQARERAAQDVQRTLLQRAFSLFDLPLPVDPESWKRGWDQKNAAVLGLLTVTGTTAVGDLRHKPLGEADGLYSIETSGKAMLSPGGAVDSGGTLLVDTRVGGTTYFDVQKGVFAWRNVTLDGRRTTSSMEVGTDAYYYQSSAAQRVDTFLPGGAPPMPLSAERAPRIDNPPEDPAAGVALVPFADLGMSPLFVPGLPEAGKQLRLPTSSVLARVHVGADGAPTKVDVHKGYSALVESARQALMGARFPAREAPYAVDVSVEFRAQ